MQTLERGVQRVAHVETHGQERHPRAKDRPVGGEEEGPEHLRRVARDTEVHHRRRAENPSGSGKALRPDEGREQVDRRPGGSEAHRVPGHPELLHRMLVPQAKEADHPTAGVAGHEVPRGPEVGPPSARGDVEPQGAQRGQLPVGGPEVPQRPHLRVELGSRCLHAEARLRHRTVEDWYGVRTQGGERLDAREVAIACKEPLHGPVAGEDGEEDRPRVANDVPRLLGHPAHQERRGPRAPVPGMDLQVGGVGQPHGLSPHPGPPLGEGCTAHQGPVRGVHHAHAEAGVPQPAEPEEVGAPIDAQPDVSFHGAGARQLEKRVVVRRTRLTHARGVRQRDLDRARPHGTTRAT